jgi:hypothetical protein
METIDIENIAGFRHATLSFLSNVSETNAGNLVS